MSKRGREEEVEIIYNLPRELKDYILKNFTGGITSLCNFHLTEKYYYWKWKELVYQKRLVSEQKERNNTLFRATKHAYFYSNFFDYDCIEKVFQIVNYLLNTMPVDTLMTSRKAFRSSSISYCTISTFLPSLNGTIQTGTKTYPQTSSLLSQDQIFTMKMVEKYMLLIYGWTLGTERDGNRVRDIKSDFSKVYLEHTIILSVPSK